MSISDNLHKPTKALGGLELHYLGDIAVIVMDCGENRLNIPFLDNFNELLDDVEKNKACKGLITTGKGKFYGNGLDLKWLSTLNSPETMKEFYKKLAVWLKRLLLFPLPTLAALNGHAFAGGALMAYAHDLRVMNKEKGWLCFNEVFISRQFLPFHLLYIRTKMGSGHNFTDAIVLGKRYTGSEALDCGLVHAAPSMSLLLSESIQLLKSFYGKSGYPGDSLYLMKCSVYSEVVEQIQKDLAAVDDRPVMNVSNNVKSRL
ncbi:enoyl-CoA delta isomerase 1, peroxisomal-like [Elysia marginata]|uniref:Enoyl-CoA delta isomerase 1, peroxisomal-like n=1 Tax=Elysia marginata TaxID=1093978 RepID=A0AAV4IME8_9GAST|nr:enoyl-CoA delta isomerase 1, peroxisomal-like [Elysia marginata]